MKTPSVRWAAITVILCIGAAAPFTAVRGELLYYEPFDYPAGPDLTDIGGGNPPWEKTGGGMTDDWNIEAGSLTYQNLLAGGNKVNYDQIDGGSRQAVRRDLPTAVSDAFNTEGTTIYLACLISDSVGFFFRGSPISINLSSDDTGGAGPVRHFLQIAGSSSSESESQFASVTPDGTAHMIAYRIINQAGNDDIRALIDPDLSQGEPDWSSATTISNRDITGTVNEHVLIMGSVNTPWRGDADEFRIATTWAEAAPLIPEPATVGLLGLGLLAVGLRRRGR